ncbi:MAG: YbaB/EbfC family nucleoid-associated protein [Acidimicrobiia bacterium]|nr:YbaB/EbfC family nucleoid-associated protein [Acidimicrobiia bacterium]
MADQPTPAEQPEPAAQPELADQPDPVGGFDLSSLLAGAQELVAAQARAAEQEVVGSAGGGAVEVRVTGGGEFRQITIRPDVVDPADVSLLEDLVLAALHDAMAQVQDAQAGALGGLGGLDLGGLGGLLGGEPTES